METVGQYNKELKQKCALRLLCQTVVITLLSVEKVQQHSAATALSGTLSLARTRNRYHENNNASKHTHTHTQALTQMHGAFFITAGFCRWCVFCSCCCCKMALVALCRFYVFLAFSSFGNAIRIGPGVGS